ncbi:MAG: helix-turn-helix transcriptional regulator [Oscillospiraceae bacterium]|nr:helix-turn-helix transcriptional regulator [Oscillospiraceae bacterium]
MMIQTYLAQRQLTKYRLSKLSGVPYATVSDICSGKAQLEKCSAQTVYKLAKALGVTMEELLSPEPAGRPGFELFKSSVCHRLRQMGDLAFILHTLENREIRAYYERGWYPESLYLLAMLDYISRVNDVPLTAEYEDLRRCRLKDTLYPSGVLALCAAAQNDLAKKEAAKQAIPEFIRFNIVESEVRDVI